MVYGRSSASATASWGLVATTLHSDSERPCEACEFINRLVDALLARSGVDQEKEGGEVGLNVVQAPC